VDVFQERLVAAKDVEGQRVAPLAVEAHVEALGAELLELRV